MKKYLQSIIVFLLLIDFADSKALAQCTCGPTPTTNNWSVFNVRVPLPIRIVRCGNQFRICKGDSLALQGKFNCMGGCNAFYKTTLQRDGVIVEESSYGTPDIFYAKRFILPGNYVLTIKPFCSNNFCLPCTFYITVVRC